MTQSVSMVHLASNNSLSYLNRFTQEQIQPNALDLRVESLREIDDTPFLIDEEKSIEVRIQCLLKMDTGNLKLVNDMK